MINISDEVDKILKEERELAKASLDTAADMVSKATVDELKRTSPKRPRSGRYAKSWRRTKQASLRTGDSYRIHNVKHYRLAHLLEYGHALWHGGRARAIPHIKPAEEKAITEFEKTFVNLFNKG